MDKLRFRLKGKTLVLIDWANVYGWFKKLKWEIDPKKLYDYLKTYPEIIDIRFYFGLEKGNERSENFHNYIKEIGYSLVWKEVKWVPAEVKISPHLRYKDIVVSLYDHTSLTKGDFEKFKQLLNYPKHLGLLRRKCDFDVEITLDVMKNFDNIDGLILFSGDGDYAPLLKEIIKCNKQAILVFAPGTKGREYENIKGLFHCNVEKLKEFISK
jgi:uncharacterized LabA/DUF88 family protein